MKKRFGFLITLLAFLASWQSAGAAIVAGQRIMWSDLKAGDSILLRNANCDSYGTSPASYTANGELYWMHAAKLITSGWSSNNAVAMEIPSSFAMDWVVVLEDGPVATSGNPTFYLKIASTGQYLAMDGTGTGNYRMWYTDARAEAMALEPTAVRDDHPNAPIDKRGVLGGVTTQVDDSTMELRHVGTDGTICYFGAAWNYGYTQYSANATDQTMWNVYRVAWDESAKVKLQALINSTSDVETYAIGTAPGQFDETAVGNFLEQRDIANDLTYEDDVTEEQWEAQLEALQAAYDAVLASRVKVSDGYYNFICGYTRYKELQDKDKAIQVGTHGELTWAAKDSLSSLQLFKVTALSDTTFSIQNVGSGLYIAKADTDAQNAVIQMSEAQEVPQTIRNIGNTDYFYLGNIANADVTDATAYHTYNHLSGRGISGEVVLNGEWGGNSGSGWRLEQVTDQELISQLEARGASDFAAQTLNNAISEAQATRDKVYELKPVITSPSQFNSNNSSTGELSAFANLIDGNVDYHSNFASTWNATLMPDASISEDTWRTAMEEQQALGGDNRGIGIGYHNLQVTLNEPLQKFQFMFIGRTNTSYVDNPADIAIYATNDDELGANPDNANQSQWTFVTEITDGFPGIVGGVKYLSPEITMDQSYKYLRFVILKSATMNRSGYYRTFSNPAVTGVTWNVGEFNIYDGSADDHSQYFTVAGMKDAVDALDAAIANIRSKISAGTAAIADTVELFNAKNAINALYVNRDSLHTVLAGLLTQGYAAYEQALPSKSSLVTDPNAQFSTNSMSSADYGSFEHLVDGLYNYENNYHSCWLTDMENSAITAADWEAATANWVAGNTSNIAIGTGYHNLQLKLNEPVTSFWFEETKRTGTGYTDTPNDIGIYVTNDDNLGADPDQANISQWTEVQRVQISAEEMPDGNTAAVTYTSPVFNLDQAYKYIRFVVYGTTHQTNGRNFANPEVTGITWNVGDLNFFTGADPSRAQYNYDPDLHSAVDALKTLLDTDSALAAWQVQDTVEIGKIRAALALVQSMLVDTTELHNLYTVMSQIATTATTGSDLGYVDSQEAINTFVAAIDAAKASVSYYQPTVKACAAAVAAMNEAYEAYAAHVAKPAVGQWYNIISATTREYAAERPMYLGSTNTGAQILIGNNYPIDEHPNGADDPYASWRLVQAKDNANAYYIQSMGTGQYIGGYRGDGADNSPLMSHTPAAYTLWCNGDGSFRFHDVSVANAFDNLKADGSNNVVLNWPANGDQQQGWKLEAISSDQEMEFNWFADNNILIFTLPWATKGDNSIVNLNAGFKTYTVKNAIVSETGSTLELTEKEEFEAGEPMVLVVNDYTKYDGFTTRNPLQFNVPEDVTDTSAVVSNGLVGTLEGFTLTKTGCGLIRNAEFYVNSTSTFIDGRSGYIDPSRITDDASANADLVLTTNGKLDNIASAKIAKGSDKVNVYTIDGTLVKRNVKVSEARNGLDKGIYIIGKQKVLIK